MNNLTHSCCIVKTRNGMARVDGRKPGKEAAGVMVRDAGGLVWWRVAAEVVGSTLILPDLEGSW